MNLYVQILSQSQTADAAQLLLLPSELQPGRTACRLSVSTDDTMRTEEFQSIQTAISKTRLVRFNQIEVTYLITRRDRLRIPGRVVSVVGLFTPSPTCALWLKSEDWPPASARGIRTRKMNAKTAESALSYYQVSRKPSVYEIAIQIDYSRPADVVLEDFTEWLAAFMPKSLESLDVFGCVDCGGPEFFVKLESNVLMTKHIRIMTRLLPSAYPELGQRFDALHPVMFGAKSVCSGIASALGKYARVIPSVNLPDIAVIRLAAGYQAQDLRSRVSNWVLPTG